MTLAEWLKIKDVSIADFADRCEVHRVTMHRIVTGRQWPHRNLAARIVAETRGKVSWDEMLKEGAR